MKFSLNINQKHWSENYENADIRHACVLEALKSICNSLSTSIIRTADGHTWISSSILIKELPLLKIGTKAGFTKILKELEDWKLIESIQMEDNKKYYKILIDAERFDRDIDGKQVSTTVNSPVNYSKQPCKLQLTDHITNNHITNNQLNKRCPKCLIELELLKFNHIWLPKKIREGHFYYCKQCDVYFDHRIKQISDKYVPTESNIETYKEACRLTKLFYDNAKTHIHKSIEKLNADEYVLWIRAILELHHINDFKLSEIEDVINHLFKKENGVLVSWWTREVDFMTPRYLRKVKEGILIAHKVQKEMEKFKEMKKQPGGFFGKNKQNRGYIDSDIDRDEEDWEQIRNKIVSAP